MQTRRSILRLGFTAAAMLAVSPASAAYWGTPRGGGTITALDDQARRFTYVRRRRAWTYQTTDKTRFIVGGRPGSWSDLKIGARVQVRWRHSHGQRVADVVGIRVPSGR